MSNILILGGDGYLGWPTALHFSDQGHDVTVVDNYMRRHAMDHLDTGMLYPVPSLQKRAQIWHELTGKEIKVVIGDLAEPQVMRSLFDGTCDYDWCVDKKFAGIPDTVVHYAEQPSAPYSLLLWNRSIGQGQGRGRRGDKVVRSRLNGENFHMPHH